MKATSKSHEGVLEEIRGMVRAIKSVYSYSDVEPPALVSILLEDIEEKTEARPNSEQRLSVVCSINPPEGGQASPKQS